MVPIYEERSIAYLHTWNLKATERDIREGLQLRPNNAKIMLTLGDLYYQKNQFEDALGAYYRGHLNKPIPPKFIHGIWAVSIVFILKIFSRFKFEYKINYCIFVQEMWIFNSKYKS